MEGFTKLSNNLPNWAWYMNNDTLAVYIRLLMGAAWSDTEYEHVNLKRGQIATTIPKLAEQNGLSKQNIRTIIARLKSTGKITVKTTSKLSIITLIDYDSATEINTQNNSQSTVNQQATNSPTLLYKEDKNIRNPETAASAAEGGGFEKALKKRSTSAYEESFERFWSCYPRKTAKQNALKAWLKLKPDEALVNGILSALERFKKTEQWLRDNGRYIPYPATWLEDRRWEDEVCSPPQNNADKSDKPPKHSSGIDTADVMERIKARYHRAVDSGGDT